MRYLFRFLLILLLLLSLGLIGLVILAIEDQPRLSQNPDLSPERLARADRFFRSNDPRRLWPGQVRTLQLTEDDVALALNVFAYRLAKGAARIKLEPGTADVQLTLALPAPLAGRFVNAEAVLVPADSGFPRFESLRIGHVRLPGALANWLSLHALIAMTGQDTVDLAAKTVKDFKIGQGRLALTYQWNREIPARVRSTLVPEADRPRFLAYRQRLVDFGEQAGQTVSLAELLPPVFQLARERSASGDPVAENRVALVVLTFYVNHRGLNTVAPGVGPWPRTAMRQVLLNDRDDYPKHFIISAALSITAGTPLADAIGIYKEYLDSRGGSGFSFNDIAADRAGTRLGDWAGENPKAARSLQQWLAAGLVEADFMPSTEGLPEFMPEAEFKQRFGGVGEPAYERMMAEIERRLDALRLYQNKG